MKSKPPDGAIRGTGRHRCRLGRPSLRYRRARVPLRRHCCGSILVAAAELLEPEPFLLSTILRVHVRMSHSSAVGPISMQIANWVPEHTDAPGLNPDLQGLESRDRSYGAW